MKKITKLITLFVLICACLAMSACSSYNKVEKALEEIGYVAVETTNENAEKMEEESEVAVTTHLFSNKDSLEGLGFAKLNVVIVLEFKATDDMKEFYEESATLQGLVQDVKEDGSAQEFYDDLVEKGFAKGNCLIISTNILAMEEVCEAIKNA